MSVSLTPILSYNFDFEFKSIISIYNKNISIIYY